MSQPHDFPGFQEIFDAQGAPLGAILGPEAWAQVRELVLERFGSAATETVPPEPIDDWRALVAFWDFKYPVDLDVACGSCGSATEDWEREEPRKFRLTAANLGGLVTFRCLSCQARIMKRHFDDEITVETRPYQAEKSPRNKGVASK